MEVLKNFYIFVTEVVTKVRKIMKIIYKKRQIDYEKTLAQLGLKAEDNHVVVSAYDKDMAQIRVAVMRAAQSLGEGRTFTVNKSINGAVITRTA